MSTENSDSLQKNPERPNSPADSSETYHQQKLERIGLLTSSIAHDFNNLLTSIIGHLSIAARMIPDAHEAQSFVNKAMLSADRATDLVRYLLEYTSKGTMAKEMVDLEQFIRELHPVMKWIVGDNILLDFQLKPDLPQLLLTKTHLQQLLINLITNAAEAIDPDEGMIVIITNQSETLELPAEGITLGQPQSDLPYLSLSVADTGQGMDLEQLKQITAPFFTTKESGHGLGLAVLSQMVEEYAAVCQITSAVGQGTTFTIYLPVPEQE